MSARRRSDDGDGPRLYWCWPVDRSQPPHGYVGSLADVIAHISQLHAETGVQHACREADQ